MANQALDRLIFGRSRPDGTRIDDEAWGRFENYTISPVFPDGYSITHATGGWRDQASGTTIKEPSTIFEVVHDGTDAARAAVLYIAQAYKATFEQDAVLRTTQAVEAELI